MKATRQVSELIAGLRHITGLLEACGVDELPSPAYLYIDITPASTTGVESERMLVVDRLARVTGKPAVFETTSGTSKYADYATDLEAPDQPWSLRSNVLVRRPDPAAELAAENARLREQLAELTAAREPVAVAAGVEHRHVGGAAGGPGENEAECACGVVFAGFDTHAEVTAELDAHVAGTGEVDQPQPARCPSGDPWCTPASPCLSCWPAASADPVAGVFEAVAAAAPAAAAGLDDGPPLEYSTEFVHGPAVADALDPPHPDWRDDEDEAQSARDLAAERRRQDRLDGDDGPDTDYAAEHWTLS